MDCSGNRIGIATGLALAMGAGLCFWLFGLAFTRSTGAFYWDAVFPLLLTSIASASLAAFFPKQALPVAVAVALPTAVWFLYMFVAVLREGRGAEWGHLLIIALVQTAALVGAFTARQLRR